MRKAIIGTIRAIINAGSTLYDNRIFFNGMGTNSLMLINIITPIANDKAIQINLLLFLVGK